VGVVGSWMRRNGSLECWEECTGTRRFDRGSRVYVQVQERIQSKIAESRASGDMVHELCLVPRLRTEGRLTSRSDEDAHPSALRTTHLRALSRVPELGSTSY
jgi:hypothetical protein